MDRHLKLKTETSQYSSKKNENMSELELAIRKRDEYIKTHPHLESFQQEIDRVLDKAGNAKNRMAVLGMMVEGKLLDLRRKMLLLQSLMTSNDPK